MDSYEHLRVDDEPLSEPEQFVLEQIEKGRIANLSEKFGEEEEKRQIRAKFLEELLTGNFDDIKIHRRGVRLSHAVITGSLDLENAEISHYVSIIDSHFRSGASFLDACFKQHLVLNRTTFTKNANFHRMQIERNIFCRNSIFQEGVNFAGAKIGAQFSARGAKFNNQQRKATFNHMQVGSNAFFNEAEFHGPVDFGGADIRRQFAAHEAKFMSVDHEATFNHTQVGHNARFNGAEFHGPVDFGGADIRGQFQARQVKFTCVDHKANFNGMGVGKAVYFEQAEFDGLVDFGGADFRGQFIGKGAKFRNPEKAANFNGMKVGNIVFFDGAIFKGGVSLADARVMDLVLRDLPEPIPALSLERTVVERELALARVQIDSLSASNLEVKVKCSFAQVVIKKDCDLRDSKFQILNLHEVTWPDNPPEVLLDGLNYEAVSAGEGEEDCKKLLAWLKGSRFNTKNYSQLEAYWQRCGHRIRADQTYVAGKKRELKSRKWGLNKIATLLLWDWLTGFGRKPGRIFGVALAFIVIGACLFTPPNLNDSGWMTRTDFYKAAVASYPPAGKGNAPQPSSPEQQNHEPINTKSGDSIIPPEATVHGQCERILANFTLRGIISLDRFLPSWVDLGVARVWEGKDIPWWTILYWNFHRVCGWVLVVLGLAALSMRFK